MSKQLLLYSLTSLIREVLMFLDQRVIFVNYAYTLCYLTLQVNQLTAKVNRQSTNQQIVKSYLPYHRHGETRLTDTVFTLPFMFDEKF